MTGRTANFRAWGEIGLNAASALGPLLTDFVAKVAKQAL
jgi:hypothetical protein